MCGGGTSSVSSVNIPPEVLQNYKDVFERAKGVAAKPYVPYSQDPNAFVAGLTPTQQASLQNINALQGSASPDVQAGQMMIGSGIRQAQPLMQQAAGLVPAGLGAGRGYAGLAGGYLGAGTQNVMPGQLATQQYMNPYTESVVQATQRAMNQQQAQQLAQQRSEQIKSGAYGGDRAGISRANLLGQQSLAQAQAIAPLYQQNYMNAQQVAQQQQAQALAAAQANRQAQQFGAQQAAALGQQQFGQNLAAAQQQLGLGQALYGQNLGQGQAYANLGLQNQAAQLQAAQAQMAAGQAQQQTDQAAKTAMYNQFQQQQGFPYQQAQFLGNLAMGTGALSGSTTTTNQSSSGIFSDKRMKDDVQQVGKTNDGLPIYRYKYKGDDKTQIGLMAQDVEKKNPDAVGLSGGFKTVDYKKATDDAVRAKRAYGGGLDPSSMGGSVYESGEYSTGGLLPRSGYADGGDPYADLASTLGYSQNPEGGYYRNLGDGESAPGDINEMPTYYTSSYLPSTIGGQQAQANADQIAQIYRDELGRSPGNLAESWYWQKKLAEGTSLDQIKHDIAGSQEGVGYDQLQGVTPGVVKKDDGTVVKKDEGVIKTDTTGNTGKTTTTATTTPNKTTTTTPVTQTTTAATANDLVYDPSKFNPYQAPMQNRYGAYVAPSWTTASSFDLTSPIQSMYQGLLGSPADQQGLQYWQGDLARGNSLQDIYYNFLKSNEYQNRAGGNQYNNYGGYGGYNNAYQNYGGMGGFDPFGSYASYAPFISGGGYGNYGANSYGNIGGYGGLGGYGQSMGGFGGYGGGYGGYGGLGSFGGYDPYGGANQGFSTLGGMGGYQALGGYGNLGGYGGGYGGLMPQQQTQQASPSAPSADTSAAAAPSPKFNRGGRAGYAYGSIVDPNDLSAMQSQMGKYVGPYAANDQTGLPGQESPYGPAIKSRINLQPLHVPRLVTADAKLAPVVTPFEHAQRMVAFAEGANKLADPSSLTRKVYDWASNKVSPSKNTSSSGATPATSSSSTTPAAKTTVSSNEGGLGVGKDVVASRDDIPDDMDTTFANRGGRMGYALGSSLPYGGTQSYIPEDVYEQQAPQKLPTNDAEMKAAAQRASSQSSGLGTALKAGLGANSAYKLASKYAPETMGAIKGGLSSLTGIGGSGAAAAGTGTAATEAAAAGLGAAAPTAEAALGATEAAGGLGALASGAGSLFADLGPLAALFLLKNGGRAGHYSGGLVPERQGHADGEDVQPDYQAMAADVANKYGLNPKDFSRVVQAESSFNPAAVGDEGSSAGLGQFHIAGASRKYPNPGLGDAYLAARQPELAKSGSVADKIAYLSDAKNAQDMLDYMGQHVAQKGYGAWTTARNMGLVPGASAYAADKTPIADALRKEGLGKAMVDTPVGEDRGYTAGIRPPVDVKGKEQSWPDFLTSRQFIIPALVGLGTMGSTPTRNFGTALSAGVLAGAQAFQPTETTAIEQEKKREEVKGAEAEAKIKNAALYQRRFVQGYGWEVLDLTKPYSGYVAITDAMGNPLPGIDPVFGKQIPIAKDSDKGPEIGEQKADQAPAKKISPVEQKAAPEAEPQPQGVDSVIGWKAATKAPANYMPENQYSIANVPEQMATMRSQGAEIAGNQAKKAENAYVQAMQLDEMQREFESLSTMQPGAYGENKLALAKKANDILSLIGAPAMFNPSDLAALEKIGKGSVRLGYATSSAINSREPGYIITGAIRANPNLESTPEGFRRLVAGLKEESQMQRDKAQYYNDYLARFGHLQGAEDAFYKANPPDKYVARAIANSVDPSYIDNLRKYSPDTKENGGKGQSLGEIIDGRYGKGTTRILMGGGLRG
jgi:hypothetical protein